MYDQRDIALCGLFIPDEEESGFGCWLQNLKKQNITIPEIGLDNFVNLEKIFGYGIKEKVPFMLVGYDGDKNKEWANANLKQMCGAPWKESDADFREKKLLYGK